MDSFSPEFAQHWLAERSGSTDGGAVERRADESPSPSQQEALDALGRAGIRRAQRVLNRRTPPTIAHLAGALAGLEQ